ncbi:uncharacterized protein LOC134293232 [Anolis carolinensis]|uniref:uncharacterized protein LOC134293232 n=1 Tax=Anolis carolinensis TaxID=28377 RepID=UPI002F2B4D33
MYGLGCNLRVHQLRTLWNLHDPAHCLSLNPFLFSSRARSKKRNQVRTEHTREVWEEFAMYGLGCNLRVHQLRTLWNLHDPAHCLSLNPFLFSSRARSKKRNQVRTEHTREVWEEFAMYGLGCNLRVHQLRTLWNLHDPAHCLSLNPFLFSSRARSKKRNQVRTEHTREVWEEFAMYGLGCNLRVHQLRTLWNLHDPAHCLSLNPFLFSSRARSKKRNQVRTEHTREVWEEFAMYGLGCNLRVHQLRTLWNLHDPAHCLSLNPFLFSSRARSKKRNQVRTEHIREVWEEFAMYGLGCHLRVHQLRTLWNLHDPAHCLSSPFLSPRAGVVRRHLQGHVATGMTA